jgi:hypothetical protein
MKEVTEYQIRQIWANGEKEKNRTTAWTETEMEKLIY